MTATLRESFTWSAKIARRSGKNFFFSFLTLPPDLFRDMCALYAYMRVSDDLGDDESQPVAERRAALADWRDQLRRALAGEEVPHPVFPGLIDVVHRRQIDPEHLLAVIDGVESDLTPRTFHTWRELQDYCYLVAGVVGLCCIRVWGWHDDRAPAAAIECGLAFQLTNILRDLAEDARAGRIYLPREDLERFGYTADDLRAGVQNDAFRELMAFEVERARVHYRNAEPLLDYLDPPGRPIFYSMHAIYGGLLNRIERRNYDVFSSRVTLPTWRKLWIAMSSLARRRAGYLTR